MRSGEKRPEAAFSAAHQCRATDTQWLPCSDVYATETKISRTKYALKRLNTSHKSEIKLALKEVSALTHH